MKMKARILAAAVVIPLICGVSLALAQRPKARAQRPKARAQRSKAGAQGLKAVRAAKSPKMRMIDTPPPGFPTAESVAAEARERFYNRLYVGNVVEPDLEAKGATLDLQNKVAKLLRAAEMPANRDEPFQHHLKSPEYRHRGWRTTIRDVSPAPGGYNVRVDVAPILDSKAAMREAYVLGTITERYFTDGKTIQHLGSEPTSVAVGAIITN